MCMVFEGSRYSNTELYVDTATDTPFLGTIAIQHINPSEDDTFYQIVEGDRLDLLANKFYGNPQLNWVLLSANPNYLNELEIKIGDVIRVPSPETVRGVLNGD